MQEVKSAGKINADFPIMTYVNTPHGQGYIEFYLEKKDETVAMIGFVRKQKDLSGEIKKKMGSRKFIFHEVPTKDLSAIED